MPKSKIKLGMCESPTELFVFTKLVTAVSTANHNRKTLCYAFSLLCVCHL